VAEPTASSIARSNARSLAREVLRPDATTEENCRALVNLLVPGLGTGVEVSLAGPDGVLRSVGSKPFGLDDELVPGYERHRGQVHSTGRSEVVELSVPGDARRCLVVAVRDVREPLGTLALVGEVSDEELPDQLGLLEHLAGLAGVLIGRDSLRRRSLDAARRSQRVASQLHQLLAASIAIGGLGEQDEILASVAQRIRGVFDADLAIVTHVGGTRELACLVATGPGRPEAVSPALAVEAFGLPRDALSTVTSGFEGTWLVAPILVRRGEAEGSLAVRRGRGGFEDDDVEVATLLAQTAASALASARLHRSVASSEERLRVLVDAAPVAIVETDHTGALQWWNRAAQELFGWQAAADEVVGEVHIPEGAAGPLNEAWVETLAGTIVVGRDVSAIDLGGRLRDLTISVAALPATEERGGSLLTVVEDVTDHRQLMEELRHAQRMEVIGQLASSVAHDFNNLLTLISGYAELLSGELPEGGHARELVDDIQASTQRASTLTGKLLTMGRTKSPSPVTFSPVESVRSLAEVLSRIVGVDVRLELALDEEAGNVRVDPDQFEQTILNLATNARDAMPEGGELRLSVGPGGPGNEDRVRIVVADTGEGMDATTRERCFEPLFTTKGPTRGTGLGLPAAKRVVTDAGGTIGCESSPGTGTTFEILLPKVLGDVERVAEVEAAPRPRGGATVLLAEDEDGIRELVSRVLTRTGYTVLEAENGERALALAEDLGDGVELLVSDVVMGGVSGHELALELQSRWPSLLVVLVSGNIDESVIDDLTEGSAAFLAKPFRPSELLEVIEELLATREGVAVEPG
jgi:PAS domain S-box-containing protein